MPKNDSQLFKYGSPLFFNLKINFMTLEEIEEIINSEFENESRHSRAIYISAKLILASHLRSQIELLDFILISRDSEVMLKVKKQKLELELTKLNQ